jgi:hypothetical protein
MEKTGHQRGATHKRMSAQSTCRVPKPRCTKCTKTSLGFLVVRLSLREPRNVAVQIGTIIQGLKHEEPKEGHMIHLRSILSPSQIAGIKGMESREQQTPNKWRAQSTSYWINVDWEQKREEWNLHSFDQLIMEQTKVGRKGKWSHNPNPLIGHHNLCATRSALCNF